MELKAGNHEMLDRWFSDEFETPDKALMNCVVASVSLARGLAKAGVNARVILCEGYIGDESGLHQWFWDHCSKNGRDLDNPGGHFVVRVGRAYIDFTARQFFPDAPYPMVLRRRDLRKLWVEIQDVTSDWLGSDDSEARDIDVEYECAVELAGEVRPR